MIFTQVILAIFSLISVNASAPDLKNSNFQLLLRQGQSGSSSNTGAAPDSSASTSSAPSTPSGTANAGAPSSGNASSTPSSGGSTPASSSSAPSTPSSGSTTSSSSGSSSPSSSSSSSGGGGGGGGQGPTLEQFKAAIQAYSKTSAGGTPAILSQSQTIQDLFNAYTSNVVPKMSLKEQAQFIANAIWETGGMQYMEEIACKTGSCSYGKYYGRGLLQLTWDYNYKAAGADLNMDLVNNPDLAAKPDGAWKTAVWFWQKNVADYVKQNNAADTFKLGYSVKKINGALECPANDKAKNRLAIYNEILKAWNISNSPGTLEGC